MFYSFAVLMFLGLIMPFAWSYGKNLLDQLYGFVNKRQVKGENVGKEIKRFFYSMDLIVYSGSIFSVFSFGIALSILWANWLILWLIVLNFFSHFCLFIFILAKGAEDWGFSKIIYSLLLFGLCIIYSCLFYRVYLSKQWEFLLAEMFGVIIFYILLLLVPPWTDRPLTSLNKLRGLIPSNKKNIKK